MKFFEATSNLHATVLTYPNRLDLWEILLKVYTSFFIYDRAMDIALEYLDFIEGANFDNASWYTTNNQKMKFDSAKDKELYLINVVSRYTNQWLNYPEKFGHSVYKVAKKLLEVYPDSAKAYNDIILNLVISPLFSENTEIQ